MKLPRYAVPIVVIIGVLALFFFPEPSSNLTAYFSTMLAFGVLIVLVAYLARS